MKPIFLTEERKAQLLADFEKMLAKTSMINGKLEISKEFEYEKGAYLNAKLWYTPTAWAKMTMLVDMFSGEVGWQGVVERIEDNEFLVSDILVYPQVVTAAHVDTNEQDMSEFIIANQLKYEEEGKCINFQGHSHVNMSVSPSGTDMEDQKSRMVGQKDGFYIFTIQNKKRESNTWIYDYDNNVMYSTKEIDVDVWMDNDELMSEFLADAKDIVVSQASTYPKTQPTGKTTYYYPSRGESLLPTAPPKKVEEKQTARDFLGDYYPYLNGYYNEDYD